MNPITLSPGAVIRGSEIKCTGCGKEHHEVRKLVALAQTTYICDECVNLCVEIVHEGLAESGLVTITAAELAELRRQVLEAGMARLWIASIRRTVALADGELMQQMARHNPTSEVPS